MLIDCHVHVNNYNELKPRPTEDIAADRLAAMGQCGVAYAVVLTSYKVSEHRPHADKVIEVFGGDPRITIVEGIRWRHNDRTDVFNLEQRIRDLLVKGIKLYPGYDKYAINDPSLEVWFRLAAKLDVPVMIHTGDTYHKQAKVRQAHPLLIDDVAVDYPDTKIILCHLGNPWFDDAAAVLCKNDNVQADISGLALGDFTAASERHTLERVREMVHYMGDPSRQLPFGTDWPLAGMKSYIRFFDGLDLTAEQKECVAWRTAARLFKIDVTRLSTPAPPAPTPA